MSYNNIHTKKEVMIMKKILFVIMVLGLLVVVGCATTQEGLSEEEISTICGDQASAIEEGLTSDEVGIICADFDMGEIQRAPEKTFKKKIRRYKTDNATLLYALYSWILVKTDESEEAIKVLLKGKKVTDNDTITRNWENLVNGRIKKFSNAGIGDEWYSLYLEEPKIQKPKQKVMRRQQF